MERETPWRRWLVDSGLWRPGVTGLVLSGGGSRASFELGALRYLYDRAGIAPTVITGTSAGAILGAFIAQYGDHEGQRAAVQALDQLWLDLKDPSELFTENLWFTRLRERTPEWRRMFQGSNPLPNPTPQASPASALPRDYSRDLWDETPLADGDEAYEEAFRDVLIEDPGAPEVQTWSPTLVMQLLGALPTLGRTGGDVPTILSGLERTRSMFRPGPILRWMLDQTNFDSTRVSASGVKLRLAFVGLESGRLRYLTEDGTIVDRDDVPLPDTPKQRIEVGVLASCAIPGVFPPVHVGAEYCVDGGLRETLPAEIAIDQLGADRVYAIVAAPPSLPASSSYRGRDLLALMMRATFVMSDEGLRDEVSYARRVGAVVIEPELDIHDSLTVDPGLIAINRDYGWLRAAEVVLGLPQRDVELHRDLIQARRDAWELETELIGLGLMVDPEDPRLGQLAELKARVRDHVESLRADVRPDEVAKWWQNWERHPEVIEAQPTWVD